jgi:hypothetical protein
MNNMLSWYKSHAIYTCRLLKLGSSTLTVAVRSKPPKKQSPRCRDARSKASLKVSAMETHAKTIHRQPKPNSVSEPPAASRCLTDSPGSPGSPGPQFSAISLAPRIPATGQRSAESLSASGPNGTVVLPDDTLPHRSPKDGLSLKTGPDAVNTHLNRMQYVHNLAVTTHDALFRQNHQPVRTLSGPLFSSFQPVSAVHVSQDFPWFPNEDHEMLSQADQPDIGNPITTSIYRPRMDVFPRLPMDAPNHGFPAIPEKQGHGRRPQELPRHDASEPWPIPVSQGSPVNPLPASKLAPSGCHPGHFWPDPGGIGNVLGESQHQASHHPGIPGASAYCDDTNQFVHHWQSQIPETTAAPNTAIPTNQPIPEKVPGIPNQTPHACDYPYSESRSRRLSGLYPGNFTLGTPHSSPDVRDSPWNSHLQPGDQRTVSSDSSGPAPTLRTMDGMSPLSRRSFHPELQDEH